MLHLWLYFSPFSRDKSFCYGSLIILFFLGLKCLITCCLSIQVWRNIRTAYGDRSDLIDVADKLSKKFEDLYEKEVDQLIL